MKKWETPMIQELELKYTTITTEANEAKYICTTQGCGIKYKSNLNEAPVVLI